MLKELRKVALEERNTQSFVTTYLKMEFVKPKTARMLILQLSLI